MKCTLRRMELMLERVGVWWSKKASRMSNHEFCCCLVGVLIKVFSGSAWMIDKQPNDSHGECKRNSKEANWTETKGLAVAHIHAQSM